MPSFLRAAGTSSTSCKITLKPFTWRCSAQSLQQPHCALLYTSTTGRACPESTEVTCPEPCGKGWAMPGHAVPSAAHNARLHRTVWFPLEGLAKFVLFVLAKPVSFVFMF